jgi:hypothetical protein
MKPQVTRYPDRRPVVSALIGFVGFALTALALWLMTAALGRASILTDPLGWAASLDNAGALDAVSNAAEVVAAVLAIAITVVAIVVELAAARYSHLITRLFIREPMNIIVLGLFLVTTIQCVWTSVTLGDAESGAVLPHAGFFITFALVTASLLALLPYINFVLTFLTPISVIERICQNAVNAIGSGRTEQVEPAQRMVLAAVDELQDVSRSAIEQGDRSIAMTGINGLSALVYDYAELRDGLPEGWYSLTEEVSQDPDFIALTPDSVDVVERDRVWLETKVFRQLFSLMSRCAGHALDVANLIAINTGKMATDLGIRNEKLLLLCIRAFNSYLRITINARDLRTAYYIMDQYRNVAEVLIGSGQHDLVVEIAGYLREYGQVAHTRGLSFLLEAASDDVVCLIEECVAGGAPDELVDRLLSVLLELDEEIKEESQEDSLLGVRRSQIKVATLFLQRGDQPRVARIVQDLKGERISRLRRLRQALEVENRPQFYELTDRGANFGYLPPERRRYLGALFEQLEAA